MSFLWLIDLIGKYEEVEKQKEEDAQKARNTVQEKEQELRQAIALSDELLSQTEEFEKICKSTWMPKFWN